MPDWRDRPGDAVRFAVARLEWLVDRDRGWPDGVKIPKIIPDDAGHRVIVVADEAGYLRIKRLRLECCPEPPDSGPIDLPIAPCVL